MEFEQLKEKLSPEDKELAQNLHDLDVPVEEIAKSLNIDIEKSESGKQGDDLEKSIDDQISEKEQELEDLKQKKLKKSINNDIGSDNFGEKIDEIVKSINTQFETVNKKVEKVENMGVLIKSLTDVVTGLRESNDQLKIDNDELKGSNEELKKSIDGSLDVLNKIASMSPGLKSLSSTGHIQRFEKSTNAEGKDVLSKSVHKEEISARLSAKMDDEDFLKSFGNDVAGYEISGKMSDKLEKAIKDELGVELVD